MSDPAGQGGTADLNAFAGEDGRLPVQRLVVAILRHQHMRDQARSRAATLDRQRRHRCLHDRLAGAAAQLRADVADHLEAGGDVFQHLALVLPDAAERGAAAAGAGAGGFVGDGLARQMIGQRRAHRRLACRGTGGRPDIGPGGRLGTVGAGILSGGIGFEFADQKFELLDVAIQLLRRAAEACAA